MLLLSGLKNSSNWLCLTVGRTLCPLLLQLLPQQACHIAARCSYSSCCARVLFISKGDHVQSVKPEIFKLVSSNRRGNAAALTVPDDKVAAASLLVLVVSRKKHDCWLFPNVRLSMRASVGETVDFTRLPTTTRRG